MSVQALIDAPRRIFAPYVVRGAAPRMSNVVFTAFVGAIGVFGLLFSLIINVAITQGAFEEAALTQEVKGIVAAQQGARQTLQMLASPGSLESRARAMGMVPAAAPVFLRLADAKVFGTPEPAVAQGAPVVVSELMPTSASLRPELQMAAAAVKARTIAPTSDAAVELPLESAP